MSKEAVSSLLTHWRCPALMWSTFRFLQSRNHYIGDSFASWNSIDSQKEHDIIFRAINSSLNLCLKLLSEKADTISPAAWKTTAACRVQTSANAHHHLIERHQDHPLSGIIKDKNCWLWQPRNCKLAYSTIEGLNVLHFAADPVWFCWCIERLQLWPYASLIMAVNCFLNMMPLVHEPGHCLPHNIYMVELLLNAISLLSASFAKSII